MQDFKLLVLGGDLRTAKMAESLARDGYETLAFATANSDDKSFVKKCQTLQEGVKKADFIVLGLPCTRDDETIEAPFYQGEIRFSELFKLMDEGKYLIAGKVGEKVQMEAKEYGIHVIDYFEREELTVLNAIPTAEGAVEIAMRELPITIHGSKSLVLGFGRVGKLMAKTLSALGSFVTVAARKHEDLAWISAYSYKGVRFSNLFEALPLQDIIINTVPAKVLGRKELSCLKKDCLVIDLASKPGGED